MMILLNIFIPIAAHSALPCAPREAVAGASQALVDHVLRVNVIDEAERRTLTDYAREHSESKENIEDRYAATGDLNCPGGLSQANVTIKGDIITTAAHSIFANDKACGAKNEATKCKFVTEYRGKTESYDVESMLYTGFDCGMYSRKTGSDWAILKLKRPVDPRIKPYRVSKTASSTIADEASVTVVGKSDDFPRTGVSPKDAPRHYGDCKARGSYNLDFNEVSLSDCDLGHRASGGAYLTPGPNPILLGVNQGGYEGFKAEAQRAGKRCPNVNSSKTSGKFSECWAAAATLVNGDFADSLAEIQKSEPSLESRPQNPEGQGRKSQDSQPAQTDL